MDTSPWRWWWPGRLPDAGSKGTCNRANRDSALRVKPAMAVILSRCEGVVSSVTRNWRGPWSPPNASWSNPIASSTGRKKPTDGGSGPTNGGASDPGVGQNRADNSVDFMPPGMLRSIARLLLPLLLISLCQICAATEAGAVAIAAARDLGWAQLSPPGYNAQLVLDRLGVDQLEDRDARAEAILAQVQREWSRAPPIARMPDGPIRMTGFAVMLADGDQPVTRILLVPYYGACIHSPPPPANQAVRVTLDRELPRRMYQFPIRVTGELTHRPSVTRHGRVLYRMTNAEWEPHPWPRQPLPVYRLP